MKIALAPFLPLLISNNHNEMAIFNLFGNKLPTYVVVLVPDDWEEMLYSNETVTQCNELLSILSRIEIENYPFSSKAQYITTRPNIINNLPKECVKYANEAFHVLYLQSDSYKIFGGSELSITDFFILQDGHEETARNYNPLGNSSLESVLQSLQPKLKQLKHFKNSRYDGTREVSSFSAYDRNNESYAKELLMIAYEDYPGNVDGETTDLYTFDKRNNTFVKFWASRNNEFHGMDISTEYAREHASWVVKKYHQ